MTGSKAQFELTDNTFVEVEFPNPKKPMVDDEVATRFGFGWRF